MLNIESINHVGIRIADKGRSITFYQQLGFELLNDIGFEQGHPVILRHPRGVVINLLGPADGAEVPNILMDVPEKHAGYTHMAMTVGSLEQAKEVMKKNNIAITGSFSFGNMSAIFIRDPDRNVIELDAYDEPNTKDSDDYTQHP